MRLNQAEPNHDIWEMLDPEGNAPVDNKDPVSEITGLRSPTYPPTSVAPSDAGGKPPGPDPPDDDKNSQADRDSRRGKDNRGKKPPRGADAHREVGLGTVMMMMETGMGTTLVIVTTVSSIA